MSSERSTQVGPGFVSPRRRGQEGKMGGDLVKDKGYAPLRGKGSTRGETRIEGRILRHPEGVLP